MRKYKGLIAAGLALAYVAAPFTLLAAEGKEKDKKAKPYPMETCVVSDEKFGGDMGDPYVFTHGNHEVKLCCKSCLKDFNKNPGKYISKIEAAEKKNPAK